MIIGIKKRGRDMKTTNINEINLQHMKKAVERIHPGKSYRIMEYDSFYSVGIIDDKNVIQPMLFNKKGAFPILKPMAEMPLEKGHVIFESGGKKDVKK